MFTGIVERVGLVARISAEHGRARRLRIVDAGPIATESPLGASISISGVCLTVVTVGDGFLEFDIIKETLDRTTLGDLRQGQRVNLERGLRVGDRLDGHFVQGHVDGTASVVRVVSTEREYVIWLEPESAVLPYIIPKGSVTLAGVSLTIAALQGRQFSVALIPTTLSLTTLATLRAGDRVNIESDMLARTIVHHLSVTGIQSADGLALPAPQADSPTAVTLERLKDAGFV